MVIRCPPGSSVTDSVTYRPSVPGDEDALAELCGELGYPSSAREVVDRMRHIIDHDDHLVVVAADESGRPVGWMHAFVARRVESDAFVELGGMVVARNRRGGGIGTQLLDRAEAWARTRDAVAVRVRSNVVRERAHRFYLRAGYSRTKTSHVFVKALLRKV